MAVTANALADLTFSLQFAAMRYRGFADHAYLSENSELFFEIASEREADAQILGAISIDKGLDGETPLIDARNASTMLSLGVGEPSTAASAAYRVQRAENTLGRMAAQLRSLATHGPLKKALGIVKDRIDDRRSSVRDARRKARIVEGHGLVGPSGSGGQSADGHEVKVWFATNREANARGGFAGERSSDTSFGSCQVFVPRDREVGTLGRGLLGRLIHGDNRVRVKGITTMGEISFWSNISTEVGSLDEGSRQALVFIHGYNTKFVDAAKRTAQLKVDLSHKGPAAFFSWPSLGEAVGYSGDEAAIEASEEKIRDFLVDFAQRSGAEAVHIIAHSMGNRGLLRAVDAISRAAASTTSVRFGQIFLAAPDVDAELFARLATAYGELAARATLYVTRNDKAIGLSKRLHRFARVGLAPPVAIVSGIDTIDASNVNLGLLGHGYAAEMRPVLADMHRLIDGDTSPDKRFGLRRAEDATSEHWEFVK